MDVDQAHELYAKLKKIDEGSKTKKGLGFSTGEEVEIFVDRRKKRQASEQPAAERRRSDGDARRRHSPTFQHLHSVGDDNRDSRPRRSKPVDELRHRNSGGGDRNRWQLSDELPSSSRNSDDHHTRPERQRRDDYKAARPSSRERRSPGRRSRQVEDRHSRWRSRSPPEKAQPRHCGDSDRSGSRHSRPSSRHAERSAGSRADRDGRRPEPQRGEPRPGREERQPRRDEARRRSPERSDRRRTGDRHDDHSSRSSRPGAERHHDQRERPAPSSQHDKRHAAKPPPADFSALIDGYDEMTKPMQLRARTRYMLRNTTKRAQDDDGQWTRFKFDDNALSDDDDVALDPKELPKGPGAPGANDRSHEAAIFGALRAPAAYSEDDEDQPQVVEQPTEEDANEDAQPLVVPEPAAAAPKMSWREKAALLKARREAQDNG